MGLLDKTDSDMFNNIGRHSGDTAVNATEEDSNTDDAVSGGEYSIHDKIEQICRETDIDRKAEIRDRIKYGDSFTKVALSIAFWGFWIFWAVVIFL